MEEEVEEKDLSFSRTLGSDDTCPLAGSYWEDEICELFAFESNYEISEQDLDVVKEDLLLIIDNLRIGVSADGSKK